MKNKPYPLYNLPPITDLRDMLIKRYEHDPKSNAFSFSAGKGEVSVKTTADIYNDVKALGTFLMSKLDKTSHIAIIGENSYEWIVAFLAIVCSGNVAVPIDKECPAASVTDMIFKSDCTAVIISDTYSDLLKDIDITTYNIKSFQNYLAEGQCSIDNGNSGFVARRISPDDLAAIFFTSGTTGSSKGVMLTHKNIATDINSACRNFVLEGDTLSLLPFQHTFGLITAIFCVFNYGKSTFINKSLKHLKQELILSNPQTIFTVPLFVETFYKQIMDSAKKENALSKLKRAEKISGTLLAVGIDIRSRIFKDILNSFGGNLEYIICGGAPLDSKYIKEFRKWGISILNGYGITECSPVVAVNRNHYQKDGSVGLVIDQCRVKISADNEILISGDNVTTGYYNDDRSTSEAIIDGWYHTGDIGNVDEHGFLSVTGRMKNLIVLSNGENISPEEIEKVILRDESVNEVIVYDDENKIVAEIFPTETRIGDESYFNDLIKRINKDQPIYKQVHIVRLRDIPFEKNSSKKILRYTIKEHK